MMSFEEEHVAEELPLVQPDPVVLEINRLQNHLKGSFMSQSSSLFSALRNEVNKLHEKLRITEDILEHKNLEIKKVTGEKKDALAAQYAAEATLRRVHADQQDDDSIPMECIIAPLEAEIKMYKNEIAALQEDKKALERHTKSKESALLEAERILRSALERALIVEEEENKILEKTHRQKVLEVEKLSQTIQELEELILSSGVTANTIRDYQRQISELQEEKKTLERELARIKVSANRIATVVANEWKNENDKVMPVKQWLEERRIMQAEMQRLKDKLAITERTAKAEAQLKNKLKLRLKTLEEGLKNFSSHPTNSNAFSGNPKTEKSNILVFLTTNSGIRKRSTSQPRASTTGSSFFQQSINKKSIDIVARDLKQGSTIKKPSGSAENMLKKGIWTSRSKVADSGEKENEVQVNTDMNLNRSNDEREAENFKTTTDIDEEPKSKISDDLGSNDVVSGFLYDRLQKEVINLRKHCEIKDSSLHAKDDEIKMLTKKVDALTKAMEIEWKKMKREAAAREKEAALAKSDNNRKNRSTNSSKRVTKEH
ncbi:microtubule-associated protein 70-5-like [Senna tora]|uniref:Microtubule-associated protein 70-5-like n=1 Tax=Senna tora TaxID=362788 RepID=A0A834XBF7_9FABA|nr:microtubule-associated protein 70-5-like [Senna tora]